MTLKDIAESIGVNASTVSRALDPAKAHLVNAATLARVREAAKHLGYRGDHVAGSLRRRATATIGVIVADLANPFIAPVIHGIAKALAAEQMLPLIFETQDDAERLTWGVDHLLSRRVDAIIVAGARFGDRPVLEAATRFTPVVVAVRGLPGSPLPHVLHDDRAGGAMAARHLIDLGHTRLAELRGPVDIGNFVARHEGFRDACRDAGVDLVDGLGFASRPIREEGERLANDLLDRHGGSLPTAVFAHNDLMALGALGVFRAHGLVCPRDVSLVGYNNSPTIDQVDPPLTSVAYPGIEVGHAAGSLALQLIARTDRRIPGAVFQPTILARDSTAPPGAESHGWCTSLGRTGSRRRCARPTSYGGGMGTEPVTARVGGRRVAQRAGCDGARRGRSRGHCGRGERPVADDGVRLRARQWSRPVARPRTRHGDRGVVPARLRPAVRPGRRTAASTEATWIKAGVEVSDGVAQVGAVVTHGVSDWSVAPVPHWTDSTVTVRVSRGDDAVTIRARRGDDTWQLVRVAPWPVDTPTWAGPYCCSPTRSGLRVRFRNWTIGAADRSLH